MVKGALQYSPLVATHPSRILREPSGGLVNWINGWVFQWKMDPQTRAQEASLNKLIQRRKKLERQRASLAKARRLMALWHTLHVPLGLAMFAGAFIHIMAAVYYATLLR